MDEARKIAEGHPVRVQLSRAKGWRMPENTVSVARPGPLGNPFIVGKDGTREDCVRLYRLMLGGYICLTCSPEIAEQQAAIDAVIERLPELRGKNLACWCRNDGKPCHADVLLELANAPVRILEATAAGGGNV